MCSIVIGLTFLHLKENMYITCLISAFWFHGGNTFHTEIQEKFLTPLYRDIQAGQREVQGVSIKRALLVGFTFSARERGLVLPCCDENTV